ncbi:GNAT family N-acetyltransferase [Neisseria weaveri]|uniref:Acetyltransferase (GNAT) family n=1 Tax=Neisseria weaveri TaxID=28091 RepID=A0A3S4ZIQ6_9NEIS|nr:GNAT family N-acetyltransferase [Neisseria weaveri]EGV37163.1 hypothetical protein l13_04750 [Neisseria weaveri ATCC 51223]EGV37224.1 hypothetical protein l11_13270 [Neisseria weaveri LMG 5135]SAY50976.1 Acetyltransferase (GNAT) family [Neisseria weaveri]VEJ49388.1 Acetyltransferase (GNAT) family [Neisseria weaveri]
MTNAVQHFPETRTFILSVGREQAGHLNYEISDGIWNITHTVVDPAFRGQGLAKVLVEAAIEEAKKHQVGLTASCDYAAAVLAKRKA